MPVFSQEWSLSSLLSGSPVPLSLQLKDLNDGWRRITLNGNGTVSGNISVNVSGNTSGSTSQNNLAGALGSSRSYVTKGETVSANGRVYLVAYHLPSMGLDLGKLLQAMLSKTAPSGTALTPESVIPLSLLDLGTIGSLEDVRRFNAQAEMAESETALRALTELLKAQGGGGSTNAAAAPKSKKAPEEPAK
jgi:hypothetical protein